MAWTAPRTWVTGELVTAAIMNQHVRDNLDHLRGLLYAGSGGTLDSGTVSAMADYRHLRCYVIALGDITAVGLDIRFNGDTGSNYDSRGITPSGGTYVPETNPDGNTAARIGAVSSTSWTSCVVDILFANLGSVHGIHSNHAWSDTRVYNGSWVNAAAITRVQVFPASSGLNAASRLEVYGLAS